MRQAYPLEKLKTYIGKPKRCIVCNSNDKAFWAKESIFKAVQCRRCGLVWIDPFLTEEGFNIYYNNYIQHRLQDKKKMLQRDRMYEIDVAFLEKHISSGRLLDIGCSAGFFLAKFNSRFKKYGIELDAKAVDYARKHFSFGKNIRQGRLEDIADREPFFDCITMRGVIEHLPEPKMALLYVSKLLKKNGYFFISATPNADSFCAWLYKEKWNQFDPVQHIYYFSARTLGLLADKFGFTLIAADYPYIETPYANIRFDHQKVLNDYKFIITGKKNKVTRSPAFWGNMMTLLFKKY